MRAFQRILLLAAVLSLTLTARAADDYVLGPDSLPQEGVPRGTVTKYKWTSTNVFPGTVRDYWIYVPAQYDPARAACLMVFQDGGGYIGTNGGFRVPTVFDNLIHRREMPTTIGLFINPGVVPATATNALPRYNRSFEYDEPSDRYARFLTQEMLPEVFKQYTVTTNAAGRAIAGSSSGAICAFAAAWERPDVFSKVFSTIGTYVGLRGANEYPTLIRKTEPKPIRVFLQDGSNDQNIYGGNWYLANLEMLSALEFAGYDVNHEWGDGGHTGKQGGAILPAALRWLWRDYPQPVRAGGVSKQPVMDILAPGENWEVVSEGHRFTEGPAANEKGELYFTDIPNNRIHKLGLDGKVTLFKEDTGGVNGLKFGPDGRLYGCQNGRKRIVAYDADGHESIIADGVESNDLAIGRNGNIYFSDHDNKKVWLVTPQGAKRVVDEGIAKPNGVCLTPDQSLLLVADTAGVFVYSFQILADGRLANKQPYFHLHAPAGRTDSGADGMAVDTKGWLYVTTHMGVQICDQAGRVNSILPKPQNKWLANVAFAGPDLGTLYLTCSDKVYQRKVKARGVLSFKEPILPPAPRL